ncbi:uncharacterized protein EI97DRAFT_463542 [Westerdykella ornata]|uniref:Uncharacterized protein n=1 Tax=Westerdykella ornata TaxID=318751 RepID=A0A6A6JY97_WESOR|nr:uncharacterized protein EI97DRAFT_463542 [Westerdykella ornata]KAF2281165.1 hypothetical protein EI97DRAFT_463542 [Westerdykella ornata]
MLSWSYTPERWAFDVTSLMVLIGEDEERKYRLSQRSLLEALAAAPVIGLQNYIRSYEFLLDGSSREYFTPYGCKTAPLRNPRLDAVISLQGLLDDGKYGVYRIRHSSETSARRRGQLAMILWVSTTWICSGLIFAFLGLIQSATWIGLVNCAALLLWSMILRTVEHYQIKPSNVSRETITGPNEPDAVFILGRRNSAFVLEGTRQQVKFWTARGLRYGDNGTAARIYQNTTRAITFFLLTFIFVTIPNGSTMDQTAFVLLNILGQINVLVGRLLNSWICLAGLERQAENTDSVPSRTHIWASLLRKFDGVNKVSRDWAQGLGLPDTDEWREWRQRIVKERHADAKQLYNTIREELRRQY